MTTLGIGEQPTTSCATHEASSLADGILAHVESSAGVATLRACVGKVDGQLHAIRDRCPHRGAQLSRGKLDGFLVTCPLHSLQFDIRTGKAEGPSHLRVEAFDANIEGGVIVVRRRGVAARLKRHFAGLRGLSQASRGIRMMFGGNPFPVAEPAKAYRGHHGRGGPVDADSVDEHGPFASCADDRQ
jgi:nitrite reductase/ring-hydroxylating ferredoxin subunit